MDELLRPLVNTEESTKKKSRKRTLIIACAGFLLILFISIPFVLFHAINISANAWLAAFVITLTTWFSLWLIVHYELDRYSRKIDPHFLILPAMCSALLICLYIFIAPELRVLVLAGWFAVLLFCAGLIGFKQAFLLSLFNAGCYLATIALLIAKGRGLSLEYEFWLLMPQLAFWAYGATVLERLQRHRIENIRLRQQLREMALFDALTGLANRRMADLVLTEELQQEHQQPFYVAMVDIDGFKDINDDYGHGVGDDLLIDIANIIKQQLSRHDFAARLGGDEFVIILKNTDATTANKQLNNIRKAFNRHISQHSICSQAKVSLSIGVTSSDSKASKSVILKDADEQLYRAKQAGKNRLFASLSD
jgi:diguanylate cyclase (GGDEF)-like protein